MVTAKTRSVFKKIGHYQPPAYQRHLQAIDQSNLVQVIIALNFSKIHAYLLLEFRRIA